jgi:hypothetical protein
MRFSVIFVASVLIAANGVAAHAAEDGSAGARVVVVFVQPERFTDVTDTYRGPQRETASVPRASGS